MENYTFNQTQVPTSTFMTPTKDRMNPRQGSILCMRNA